MSETPRVWKYLERRPGSSYQQLCIKGKRIRLLRHDGHDVQAPLAVLADDDADWRPTDFRSALFGCEAGIRFPV